jgi:hypothetical protein
MTALIAAIITPAAAVTCRPGPVPAAAVIVPILAADAISDAMDAARECDEEAQR